MWRKDFVLNKRRMALARLRPPRIGEMQGLPLPAPGDELTFCGQCGVEVPDDAEECPECGTDDINALTLFARPSLKVVR